MRKYAIVFVHGLAKKPPVEKLEEIWRWAWSDRTRRRPSTERIPESTSNQESKPSGHEALVQCADIKVYRDLNEDFEREGDATFVGLFGVNQHWGFDLPLNAVGNASAGCLVGRTKQGHREFMAALKQDPRYLASRGYRFMTTVLPAQDVVV